MKNLSSREVIVSLILVFAILGIFLFTDILSKTGKGTEFPPDPGAPSAEAADIKVSIGTLTGLPRVGEEYLIPVIVANDGSMDSENPLTLKLLVYNEAKSNFEERKVVSNVGPIKEGSRISLNIPYIRSTDDLSLTTKRILIKVVAESAEIDLNLQNNEKEFAFEQQRAELKLEVGAVRKGKSTPVIPVRVSNIGNLDYTSNIVTKFILNLNNFGEMILAETTIPSLSAGSFKDFELEFSPVNEDFLQPGKYSGLYVISNGIRSPISADSVLAAQATQPATQTALTGPDLKLELGTIGKATVNTAYEIPVTIRNIGGTSTSKSISVQYDLYDTATSTWKPHGQAVTITNPIAPGASTTAKLIFPAKSATGKYSLWAILTSAEDVNGANNDAMFDLEVALGSIDVKAEVTTLPQTFVIGQRMAIPIKLTNIGTVGTSSATVAIYKKLSSGAYDLIADDVAGNIGAQQTKTIELVYYPASTDVSSQGTISLKIVAGVSGDTNIQNNEMTFSVNQATAQVVDLKFEFGTVGKATVNKVHKIPIKVSNLGGVSATKPITVEYSIYDVPTQKWVQQQKFDMYPVAAGQSTLAEFSFPAKSQLGEYSLWAIMTSTEDNTGANNDAMFDIEVIPGSIDVKAEVTTLPQTFVIGQRMAIPIKLTNIGTVGTSSATVAIYKKLSSGAYDLIADDVAGNIGAQQTKTIELVYYPASTDVSSQGTISLKIVAGVSGDTNIQNNEMTFSVTKTALTGPDLKLELGAIGKATVNTAYEIPVTIRNIGGTSTSKSISVQYDLYDAATGAYKPHGQTVTINNPIAPGATANVNLRFPAKSVAGKYSLWAILTSAEDVNGANNDALFDLDVVSSGIDVKAEFGAIEIPVVGTRKIIPVTLKNIGTVDASKGVKMTFYVLSPAGLHESKYTTSINSLDVQESVVVNVPYTPSSADITNSKVTIKVEAEVDGVDVDTSNNVIIRELSTIQGINIKLQIGSHSTPVLGTRMVIPVTLTNLGGYDLTKGAKILLKVINNGQYSTRSTTDIAELKSLQSITVNVPYVPLAGDITNSKVTIKVEAEVDGIDVDTSDNSITRELSTMQGVEIKLDLGTVGKATVDTAYEIPFAVTNIGNVATTKPIQIKYDLFDEATKTYKPHGQTLTIINLLAPGTSASIKLQFPAKSMAKVYSLWAVLYSDEDFSKSNNEQVFELEVIPVAPQGQGTQPPGGSSSGSSSSGSGRRGGSGGGVIVPKVIPKPIPDTKAGGKVNIKVTEDSVVSSLGLTFKGNQPAGFINFISLDDVPVGIPAPPYDVYAYFEIRHDSILNVNLDEVELLFKVEEEWLAAREASKDDIILLRYNNDWELMPVIYLNSDVRYHNYQADLPGLSVFAIAKKNAGFDEAPEEEEKPKKPINWVAVIIIILVLLIVGGALIFLAIRNKPQTGKPDLQSTVQKLKGQGYSESQIRGMMYKKGADMQKLEEILKKIK